MKPHDISDTRPITRETFGLKVLMQHKSTWNVALNILLLMRVIFEPVTFRHVAMSRNYLNQKFNLMVKPIYLYKYSTVLSTRRQNAPNIATHTKSLYGTLVSFNSSAQIIKGQMCWVYIATKCSNRYVFLNSKHCQKCKDVSF